MQPPRSSWVSNRSTPGNCTRKFKRRNTSLWRNKKFYVEHLIYSFHFHCFLFLFLGVFMLLQVIFNPFSKSIMEWLTLPVTLYIIWYIYRSLRVVYQRNIFRTITKMIGMWVMYFAALTFCMMLVLFITTII